MNYVNFGSDAFLNRCKKSPNATYPSINSVIEAVLERAGKYKNLGFSDCERLILKLKTKYHASFSWASYKYSDSLIVCNSRIYQNSIIYSFIKNGLHKRFPSFVLESSKDLIEKIAFENLEKEYEKPFGEYCLLEGNYRCNLCNKVIAYRIKNQFGQTKEKSSFDFINKWMICNRKKCKVIASKVKKGNDTVEIALIKAIKQITKGVKTNERQENATY